MKILYYSWDISNEFNYPAAMLTTGLDVETFLEEEEVLEKIKSKEYDILIVDTTTVLNYKKMFIAKKDHCPELIIFAITNLDNNFIIEEAFEFGLNDYIMQGLTPKQFTLKVRSNLHLLTLQQKYSNLDLLSVRNLSLNPYTREAIRGKENIPLTNKEYRMLELLLLNKNRIVSREEISKVIWDRDKPKEKNNIGDVYINFLRKKIENDEFKYISTIRGVGYIIKDIIDDSII